MTETFNKAKTTKEEWVEIIEKVYQIIFEQIQTVHYKEYNAARITDKELSVIQVEAFYKLFLVLGEHHTRFSVLLVEPLVFQGRLSESGVPKDCMERCVIEELQKKHKDWLRGQCLGNIQLINCWLQKKHNHEGLDFYEFNWGKYRSANRDIDKKLKTYAETVVEKFNVRLQLFLLEPHSVDEYPLQKEESHD